jgi:hypothetical protein
MITMNAANKCPMLQGWSALLPQMTKPPLFPSVGFVVSTGVEGVLVVGSVVVVVGLVVVVVVAGFVGSFFVCASAEVKANVPTKTNMVAKIIFKIDCLELANVI